MILNATGSDLPPVKPGPYPVAATSFFTNTGDERLLNRAFSGDRLEARVWSPWDVLENPSSVRAVAVQLLAADPVLGECWRTPYFLLYPTTPNNQQPDIKLLQSTLPHVQRIGGPLLLAETGSRFPLILFSHGYRVHPFYDLPDLVMLASHGYVVACVLHADGRMSSDTPGDWNPLVRLRAATLRAVIDALRVDPEFSGRVDFSRIGVFGISLGGGAAMELLGASIPGTGEHSPTVAQAFFGESPALFPYLPGKGGSASAVQAPVFAVVGSNDTLAAPVKEVLDSLSGPRWLLELPGQGHVPDDRSKREIIATWAVHFFDAILKQDVEAKSILKSADHIATAPAQQFVIRPGKP